MSLSRWVLRLICPHCEARLAEDRLGRAEQVHALTTLEITAERQKMEARSADIRITTNALIRSREETERARQKRFDDAS